MIPDDVNGGRNANLGRAVVEPEETLRVLEPGQTYASVTDKISAIALAHQHPRSWLIGFITSSTLLMVFCYATAYVLIMGIGVWGNNVPVAWAFDIINFVWWIGIGHAGTLISAVLLLFRQEWRTSINRFAEAMTLFAVACAGLYPILHLGRPWVFYWLMPYPNTFGLWPQFRSPLIWDVFAVSTYATVSFLFWYVGLIPDFAVLRDRSKRPFSQIVYGILAMGWRGSAIHWQRYETAYLLLAGLATPLVVSVHTIVGFDFAVSIVPGWHQTLLPPYFVAGAIFSGFAMVMTLAIPLRSMYGLEDFITLHHLDNMAKVMLATGLMVGYGYLMEVFCAWYSGNQFEWYVTVNRAFGPYALCYWALIACNIFIPQLMCFRSVRHCVPALFVISLIVNIGMWLERFVIIVISLHRDYLPSAWEMYYPSVWDFAQFFGSIGLFFALLFLFVRFIPVISIFELRELVHETEGGHKP
ncbi:MAG: NrfD/PsrC family molybdoenzyme membrane anchor subunit [Planctomycetota bacterium]